MPAMPYALEKVRRTTTSLSAATRSLLGCAVDEKWMYASSTTTTASFFLFANKNSISARAVMVPVGLFGLQT